MEKWKRKICEGTRALARDCISPLLAVSTGGGGWAGLTSLPREAGRLGRHGRDRLGVPPGSAIAMAGTPVQILSGTDAETAVVQGIYWESYCML